MMTASEQQVIEAVKALDMPYELITIDPSYADTVAFCEHYGYPPEQSGNTIIVVSKREPKKFAACVVLATTQLDVNRRVKQLLGGGRASFASAEDMQGVTGMQVGGVTPFALPAELPLYVDARLMQLDWIILGGGGRNLKIKLSPEVFRKLGAEVVPDLAIERSGTGITS